MGKTDIKRLCLTIVIFALMLFAGQEGFAQVNTQKADSLKLKENKEQTAGKENGQNANGNAYGKVNNANGLKSVKQVKGGRPDMSKARGARPPVIVRPSGSGIPKGVGKPGGVGRKGGI